MLFSADLFVVGGKWKMLRSSTGKAAVKARASRHKVTKMVCDDVKVEPDLSTRSMADLIGGMAAKGWRFHKVLSLAINYAYGRLTCETRCAFFAVTSTSRRSSVPAYLI